MGKTFQELDLSNAFLFAATLEDEETCRAILETILGFPVGKVKVHAEHSVFYSTDFRSIRLDIYASDETYVAYDLEMQNEDEGSLAQRSRYYQAEMDVTSLKPGEKFSQLRPSYVIFICTFDPFGRGLYRYTFGNWCEEEGFPLEDGTKKIFLNTKGCNQKDVPDVLVNFLHYLENSTEEYVKVVDDQMIRNLHQKVTQLKRSREWGRKYMKFEELLQRSEEKGKKEGHRIGKEEGQRIGKEEGQRIGQARILKLMTLMTQDGETGQLSRLSTEPEFLEEMLEKYHL